MPDWKAIVRERLAGLGLRGAREAEIVEELAQDLEERYGELRAQGLPETDARRRAEEVLGHSELLTAPLEPAAPLCGFRHDVRLALRNMRARPLFTLLATGMLALSIGGNAAIFSIFNGMFLRPLPFPNSERLVDVDETAPKWNLKYVGVSNFDCNLWRKQNSNYGIRLVR